MPRADARLEGMSKRELRTQLELCRRKQRDLSAVQSQEYQGEIEAAWVRVQKRYKRRFEALYMWDRRYCAALIAFDEKEREAK